MNPQHALHHIYLDGHHLYKKGDHHYRQNNFLSHTKPSKDLLYEPLDA